MEFAKSRNAVIIDYTLRENVAERLVRQFGAAVGAGAVRAIVWSGFRLQ